MKRFLIVLLCFSLIFSFGITVFADSAVYDEAENTVNTMPNLDIKAKSAILMDAQTGTVLYCKNENEPLPPASVTKIMTLLLVMEAIENGTFSTEDKVIVSTNASLKGGSQIFLEEGEEITVLDLLKSTIIASANDSATALAELVSGSEAAFVDRMNARAKELGLKNTSFENCTGLDDTVTNHVSSAYDIALMSRELIKYDLVLQFSSLWQDTVRNGEFTLTNTNRLVRYYSGCTGLKTGSTDQAGFCVSATAKRNGMHLIAVVMGSDNREDRNEAARCLLDYGFSGFSLYCDGQSVVDNIPVYYSATSAVELFSDGISLLVSKGDAGKIEKKYEIPDFLVAPQAKGTVVGSIKYFLNDKELGSADIYVSSDVERLSLFDIYLSILKGTVA